MIFIYCQFSITIQLANPHGMKVLQNVSFSTNSDDSIIFIIGKDAFILFKKYPKQIRTIFETTNKTKFQDFNSIPLQHSQYSHVKSVI